MGGINEIGPVLDEAWYLERYPDVAERVRDGTFDSATDHYVSYGQAEGRLARSRQSAGGLARARNLSPERRSEIAQEAATVRWRKAEGRLAGAPLTDHRNMCAFVGGIDWTG
jgi:hypothetical protein